jgi:two-component system alkaline phosphatase synthesis response regulator PhoP
MAYKILVVDDETDIRFVLRQALEEAGYQVSEAADGIETMQKIKEERPDLILLDIMMPKLDGYSVNLRLKDDPETAHIPVFVITGKGHVQELLKIREELQVAEYLEKPFTVKVLLQKMQEILR